MINKIFKKKKIILGIETSFDDTSSSILKGNKILSNIIYTQKKEHIKYKGIIPNIASNIHLKKIFNIVKLSIKKSNININNIDGIAFTRGPGLIGSLIIGENFAKSISLCINKPLFGINHIQAHILSFFIYNKEKIYPKFPYLCLSISGGHTKLVIVNNFFNIKIIGQTLDDSLGNLFDKLSIYLGLNYYNGSLLLEKYCYKGKNIFKFPIPNVKNLNFSFSGLKTYLFNFIKKNINNDNNFIKKNIYNISRSFHETIFKILIKKIKKAMKINNIINLAITGGVTNNKFIKKKFIKYSKKKKINFFYLKNKSIINDNAAMIALVGQIKYYYKLYDNYNIVSNTKFKIENYNL
ncbi:MAG: tRNA (adenosine(37)-N6)-threonylcarbamoyltransferase complex transferase subunit TsaD [Candidatus Shikimatogenerans bostrichidophilus]|nr:MAG: tRNA (adenosine(37)-N6)-threonylcarbamoyltransferase complex transferase subunit TsaD [Candidatus Shikimatogenerans bostrichidophilus]